MTASSTNPPSALNLSGRIPELDGLRGVAIGMVLFWHFFALTVIAAPATPLSYALVLGRLTWSGVDLFFVLSGFLIGGILLDARTSTNYFRVFYTRRFFRIFPLYAMILLFIPALTLARHGAHATAGAGLAGDSAPWYMYWTFTQNLWMAYAASLGTNSLIMTWSLAIEEQFYLTLPLIVRFISGRRLLACVLTGLCLAPMARTALHHFWPRNWVAAFALMPCRADALLLGVLAAILLRDDRCREYIRRNDTALQFLLLVLLAGVAFLTLKSPVMNSPLMQLVGYTWLALFYVSVLLFALTRRNSLISRALRFKWLGWLGSIAYGTYLLHQGIQRLVFRFFFRGEPFITGGYSLAITLAALLLTLVTARLSWIYFEKPLVKIGHRSSYKFGVTESVTAMTPLPTEGN